MQSKRFDKCGKNLLKLLLIGFLIKLWKIDGRPPAPRKGHRTGPQGAVRKGRYSNSDGWGYSDWGAM